MTNYRLILVTICLALSILLLTGGMAAAQSSGYDLSWWVVAGGGTSSGGSYTLSGAIGQTNASSVMSGESYTLVGGFWGENISGNSAEGERLYLPLILHNH